MIFSEYINKNIECQCGRTHSCFINDIIIKDNAIEELPPILNKYKNIFMVADENTWRAAGEKIDSVINKIGDSIKVTRFIFDDCELVPDERAIGTLFVQVPVNCDLVVAVGSGTINDLCKLVSDKINADYCIVATAPSMDGFASNVSPLILNHLKTTVNSKIPNYIIGDLKILQEAPKHMIAAGAGDIIGKYVCLVDWRMAAMINGEYYCSHMEALVRKSIQKVVEAIEPYIGKDDNDFLREKATVQAIMEGLVLSGIAMSFVGNSRPASGSEHHMSHYWEMMFLFEERKMILHGTKVAIGTVEAIKLYEKIKEGNINFIKAKEKIGFDREKWIKNIEKAYREAAPSVIDLEDKCQKNSDNKVKRRVENLEKNWSEALEIMEKLPTSDYVIELLKAMKAPYLPEQVGVDKKMLRDSILYAKELRDRYGLLQILFDLSMV